MGFQVELFPHRIPSDDAVPRHDVSQRSLRVPDVDPVNWQPLSQMPLIASMIDGALNDTRTHVGTLNEAQAHVLDNATIDRIERVHNEQMKFVDIYDQQVRRWRTQKLLPDQARKLDRMEEQNRQLRTATMEVLALAGELRKGSINHVMGMSDLELGLQVLISGQSTGKR